MSATIDEFSYFSRVDKEVGIGGLPPLHRPGTHRAQWYIPASKDPEQNRPEPTLVGSIHGEQTDDHISVKVSFQSIPQLISYAEIRLLLHWKDSNGVRHNAMATVKISSLHTIRTDDSDKVRAQRVDTLSDNEQQRLRTAFKSPVQNEEYETIWKDELNSARLLFNHKGISWNVNLYSHKDFGSLTP